jgi:hypothetical protein
MASDNYAFKLQFKFVELRIYTGSLVTKQLLAHVSLIIRMLMKQIKLSDPALRETLGYIHSTD